MLLGLSIRDVVLIDRLDLEFSGGLSALTGETGAGKSILLDALGLALGVRGDSALVRKGAQSASVTAAFDLPGDHPAVRRLREQDIAIDGPLLLRRTLGLDGRSRAFVNDQPTSVGLLRELGASLVEIHGQFDNQGLLDSATHRQALDLHGGLAGEAAKLGALFAAWQTAVAGEDAARAEAARSESDQDYLRHALAELDALDPRPGEEQELAARRTLLSAREKLADALNAATAELSQHKGVAGALRAAQRHLERVAQSAQGRLDDAIAALDRAAIEASEAALQVEQAGAALDVDTGDLERAEERLFALRGLARKHRVEVDRLPALRGEIADRLATIDDRAGRLARLAAAVHRAREAYLDAARGLSAVRSAAAAKLDRAVARELPPLKLEKATFRTRSDALTEAAWSAHGTERITFEVATNPGVDPGPLDKIASGGELARFMLALKVVLARSGATPTMVFDEVDSGIGGAAAAAVGERLARLASGVQVLVVTHSPQVAARADHHWRVSKKTAKGAVVTTVEPLDEAARREEIARLLSGARITEAARAAAESLLAGARA
ncbi:MAG TPA: DNA repair protein RecN [Alphaproteobacteria bacterium]|nr:DNA repair protein RecN [Alphaproteobacteria bacterium]